MAKDSTDKDEAKIRKGVHAHFKAVAAKAPAAPSDDTAVKGTCTVTSGIGGVTVRKQNVTKKTCAAVAKLAKGTYTFTPNN